MHPSQQYLLQRSREVTASLKMAAAAVLWKYTDGDAGKDFYLQVKKMTVKSPWSGKTFSAKPEKVTIGDVGKELKQDGAKVKGALWKYVDDEANEFYLQVRTTSTIRSPFSGKAFTPKPAKEMLTEIAKKLKGTDSGATRADGESVNVSVPAGALGDNGTGGGSKAAVPKSRGKKKASDDLAWKAFLDDQG